MNAPSFARFLACLFGVYLSLRYEASEIRFEMTQTIDPVFTPDALQVPGIISQVIGEGAFARSEGQLIGKLDKNPKTAAIILAGGTGERFGREGGKQADPYMVGRSLRCCGRYRSYRYRLPARQDG